MTLALGYYEGVAEEPLALLSPGGKKASADRDEYNFAKTIKISIPFLVFTYVGHYVLTNIIIYKLKNQNYSVKIELINHMGITFEDKLKKITIHLIQCMVWAQKEQIEHFSNNLKQTKLIIQEILYRNK